MSILFLAPHAKISGGMRAVYGYADLLAGRGHQVTVAVPLAHPLKRLYGNAFARQPRWMGKFRARLLWVPSWDEKYLPDADALVATAWSTAEAASRVSERKGKKFYFVQHYEPLYHAQQPGHAERAAATYALPFRKIAISSWLRDVLREKHGADAEVIVTPVDCTQFYYVPEARKGRAREARMLLLNHDAAWKGTARGAAAAEEIKKQFPEARLVMFGARARKPSFACDEYHYNPPQEKLRELYSSCHIYLCPSEWEGLGMPGMEAMACRAALVTFDTGGSRDYAFDRRTAYVARHGDFADFTRKLADAAGNIAQREQIARAGERFIRENFSWDRASARFEEMLMLRS